MRASFLTSLLCACATLVSAAPMETFSRLSQKNTIRPAVPYCAGFNAGAFNDNGGCKTPQDWVNELRMIKSWSNGQFSFTTVKIYTTQQCDTLKNALAAAQQVGGIKIWAGLWVTPPSQFELDKAALSTGINGPQGNLIAGISVGSEEMLRGTPASTLAGYIWDVKGMVQNAYKKSSIPVGTSDGAGVLRNQNAVTDAIDFAQFTDYPYYGGANINNALTALQNDWAAVQSVMGSRPVMIGETGWPTAGDTIGAAVANPANAQRYWKSVACWLKNSGKAFFWFSDINELWKPLIGSSQAEHAFGVGSSIGAGAKFSLTC